METKKVKLEGQSKGMVDLLLNILENSRSSKEDKTLARDEVKRMIKLAEVA